VDWGNVPAWVSSILTGSSLLIAAFSYRRSVLDKERDQASKVAAWISIADADDSKKRVLRISNSSDASVYAITAKLHQGPEIYVEELPAKSTSTADLPGPQVSSTETRRTTLGVSLFAASFETAWNTELLPQEPSPELQFRDAVGRWWQRMPNGQLKRQSGTKTHTRMSRVQLPFGISMEFRTDAGSAEKNDRGAP
jgi:hypothetical protein